MLWTAVWLASTAPAHPFGARFAAHQIEVDIAGDRIDVRYFADVPNPIVATATRDPSADPIEAMAQELRTGLVLQIDGETQTLTPTADWSVKATDDTQQFRWTFTAALDQIPHRVEVSNANLPDVMAVYNGTIQVAPGLEIERSSLWRMRDEVVVRDESGRWRTDEKHRRLWAEIRSASAQGLWWMPLALIALGAGAASLTRARGGAQEQHIKS